MSHVCSTISTGQFTRQIWILEVIGLLESLTRCMSNSLAYCKLAFSYPIVSALSISYWYPLAWVRPDQCYWLVPVLGEIQSTVFSPISTVLLPFLATILNNIVFISISPDTLKKYLYSHLKMLFLLLYFRLCLSFKTPCVVMLTCHCSG